MEVDLLPIQVVYDGKSHRILPLPDMVTAAEQKGFHLTCTPNYWSNQKSMQDYLLHVLEPYICERQHLLKPGQALLILMDSQSVHKSAEFREWLFDTEQYKWCYYIYIPPCMLQPADISLNAPLKVKYRQNYTAFMAQEVLSAGVNYLDFKSAT